MLWISKVRLCMTSAEIGSGTGHIQLDWITHPLLTDALFVCGVGACIFLFYSLKKEIYLIRERWLLSIAALSSALETTDERLSRLRSELEKSEAVSTTT